MPEPPCTCGHQGDDHEDTLGYCTMRSCRCVLYRPEDEEEEDDGVSELNFEDEPDLSFESDWEDEVA